MGRQQTTCIGYGGLAILLASGMLGGLTQTAMNTTLVSVIDELGISVTLSQWLVSIFPLCLGVVIPLSAHLCRSFTARQLFLISVSTYLAGSIILIFGQSFAVLLLGRTLQAIAAGVILPLMQVVVFSQFPLERRGTLMGFVGLSFGFAPNVGPTIAGAFTTHFGWRSAFVFLAAFALVMWLLGFVFIESTPVEEGARKLDLASVLLSSFGFGGILMGFTNAADFGLTSLECILPFVVGIVSMVAFCIRQLRINNPLMDLRALQNRRFSMGTIIICLIFSANIGTALAIPLELQALHGFSAFEAGLALLPGTAAALIVNPVSGMVMDRTGARRIACTCSICLLLGSLPFLQLGNLESMPFIMACQLMRQIGISGVIMPINTWSLNALPKELMPDGNSLTNTLRQVAAALSTAIFVLFMTEGVPGGQVSVAGVNASMAFGLVCVAVLAVLCFVFVHDDRVESRDLVSRS